MREGSMSVLVTITYPGYIIITYDKQSVSISKIIFKKDKESQIREGKQQVQVHMTSRAGFELMFV